MARPVPTTFGGDILLWSAWLYHVENQTQNEIAEELGISRQSVANYLNEALKAGLVQINLDKKILARQNQSLALKEKFGLEAVHIIPPPKSENQLLGRLGRGGGQVLAQLANDGDTIGVAFGRTVFRIGNLMPAKTHAKTRIVQVAGCSIGGLNTTPEVCASLIASKLSAQCINLFAPAYLSSEELTKSLLDEPTLKRQFGLFKEVNLLLFGIGELNENTRFYINEEYFLNDKLRDHYRDLGAVSVIFGRFLDRDGNEVDGPLRERTVAVDLETARASPIRLAVCGGKEKVAAAAATLRAGYATHLVTDERTAKRLLRSDD